MLPSSLLHFISTAELAVMISGPSKIDLEEMRKNTTYYGHSSASEVVEWFWEIMEEFDQN